MYAGPEQNKNVSICKVGNGRLLVETKLLSASVRDLIKPIARHLVYWYGRELCCLNRFRKIKSLRICHVQAW